MVQIINMLDTPPEVDRESAVPVNKAENRSLYASREAIHPKAAHGRFRRFKWAMVIVLLGIYYIAPWLRWTRPGDAPRVRASGSAISRAAAMACMLLVEAVS